MNTFLASGMWGGGRVGGGGGSRHPSSTRENPGYSHIFKMLFYKIATAILLVIGITFCMQH